MLHGEESGDEDDIWVPEEKEAELEMLRRELERERKKEKRRKEQVYNWYSIHRKMKCCCSFNVKAKRNSNAQFANLDWFNSNHSKLSCNNLSLLQGLYL